MNEAFHIMMLFNGGAHSRGRWLRSTGGLVAICDALPTLRGLLCSCNNHTTHTTTVRAQAHNSHSGKTSANTVMRHRSISHSRPARPCKKARTTTTTRTTTTRTTTRTTTTAPVHIQQKERSKEKPLGFVTNVEVN